MEKPLSIRQALWDEARENGVSFSSCPESVAALLKDRGLWHRAASRPLVESVRCGVPTDLLRFREGRMLLCYFYLSELIATPEKQLENLGREQIEWVVETWIMVLGLAPLGEIQYPAKPSPGPDACSTDES